MTDIHAASTALVATLTGAGIRATIDPRDVNPPCVLVAPPVLAYRFGKRCWDASWSLLLIAGDHGKPGSLRALGDLLDAVQAATGGAIVTATPANAGTLDGTPPAPAYECIFTTRITE